MPWKESRIVDQRLQFLSSYQKGYFRNIGECLVPPLKAMATELCANRLIEELHRDPCKQDHERRKEQSDIYLLLLRGVFRLNPIRIDIHEWVVRHIKRIRESAAGFTNRHQTAAWT
jgi:hypothetical protein